MTASLSTQIEIDGRGVAWIAGTRVKVIEIVMDKMAHGWSPEEIHFQHPNLSMAQIHGALTYYYENQTALDASITQSLSSATELAKAVSDEAFRDKLRTRRLAK